MRHHTSVNQKEFTGKYEECASNPIWRALVNRFFKSIEEMMPHDIITALETGCGAGYSTQRLARMLPKATIHASDIGGDLVKIAQEKNPHIKIKIDSLYDLSEKDGAYDIVIALETLEHLEYPEKALEELCRVTKKYVLISVPREPLWRVLNMARGSYWSSWGNTPGHLNHWSTSAFRQFISTHFIVVETKTPLPWTMVLAQKKDA